MITRTARETVMLEALERVRRKLLAQSNVTCPARFSEQGRPASASDCNECLVCIAQRCAGDAYRAIATVKAMDEAELAAGTARSAVSEVIGG